MRITNIEITNYRCFNEEIKLIPKSDINIFVGENNSGKSTIFRLLEQIHSIPQFHSTNFGIEEWHNNDISQDVNFKIEYDFTPKVLNELYELKKKINISDWDIIKFLFLDESISREVKKEGTAQYILWECQEKIKEYISTLRERQDSIDEIQREILNIIRENSEFAHEIDEFIFTNSNRDHDLFKDLLANLIFFSRILVDNRLVLQASIKYDKHTNPSIIIDRISRINDRWNYHDEELDIANDISKLGFLNSQWLNEIEKYIINLLSESLLYIKEIRKKSILDRNYAENCPEGLKLNQVLYTLKMHKKSEQRTKYNYIRKEFHNFYPNHEFEVVEESEKLFIQVTDLNSKKDHKLEDYGTGMMDILIIITNLFTAQGKIIFLEEPETHIHPIFQQKILNLIERCGNQNQIFITTHSPVFISSKNLENVLRIVKEPISSNVYPFNIEYLKKRKNQRFTNTKCDINTIRVRYSKILTPDVKNSFFSRGIILVEGETEKLSLPIWCKINDFDLHQNSIEIVNCYSKYNIIDILELFQMYKFPIFVIFDMDNPEEVNHEINNTWILNALNFEGKITLNQNSFNGGNFFIFSPNIEDTLYKEDVDYKKYENCVIKENKFRKGAVQKGLKAYNTALKYQEKGLKSPEIIKDLVIAIKNFFI